MTQPPPTSSWRVTRTSWLAVRRRHFPLPNWLSKALTGLMADRRLAALYVVSEEYRWEMDADQPLRAARFDGVNGLIELSRSERGARYTSLREYKEPSGMLQYHPWPVGLGAGVGSIAGSTFGSVEVRLELMGRNALHIQAGAAMYQDRLSPAGGRGMGLCWLGVMREPSSPELGWLYGVSSGIFVHESARTDEDQPVRFGLSPTPRAHLGVEWPLRRNLYVGRGARFKRTATLRLEMIGAAIPGAAAFNPDLSGTAWAVEGRLGIRLWRTRHALD